MAGHLVPVIGFLLMGAIAAPRWLRP